MIKGPQMEFGTFLCFIKNPKLNEHFLCFIKIRVIGNSILFKKNAFQMHFESNFLYFILFNF